jgi:hypothetical protein
MKQGPHFGSGRPGCFCGRTRPKGVPAAWQCGAGRVVPDMGQPFRPASLDPPQTGRRAHPGRCVGWLAGAPNGLQKACRAGVLAHTMYQLSRYIGRFALWGGPPFPEPTGHLLKNAKKAPQKRETKSLIWNILSKYGFWVTERS